MIKRPRKKTALDSALVCLASRPRSVKELREMLAAKKYPPDDINAVIDRLIGCELLDDDRYALLLAESRHRYKQWGPAKIRAELRLKGIKDETIKHVLASLFDQEEAKAALEALASWLRKNKAVSAANLDKYGTKESIRALRHLAGRGFSQDAAFEALKRCSMEKLD